MGIKHEKQLYHIHRINSSTKKRVKKRNMRSAAQWHGKEDIRQGKKAEPVGWMNDLYCK